MSILIKGMEMPKNCDSCLFDDGVHCMAYPPSEDMVYDIADGKPSWCPLVPIPPHGRLIDADELLALVYANIALFDSAPGRLGADQKLVRAWLASMAEDINDAPTIIPASEEGET